MRLNLLLDPADARPDFLNVSVGPTEGVPQGVSAPDWADLSAVCAPGEADAVVALGVLEHLPRDRAGAALAHWCGLVGVGGSITVGSADPEEVAYALATGGVPPDRAEALLHGEGGRIKYANYSARRLAGLLEAQGLVVTRARLDGLFAAVTAERR